MTSTAKPPKIAPNATAGLVVPPVTCSKIRRNGTNTSARRRRVSRRLAPRMLRNRSRPRRSARSRVMDSPRNLRTANSVIPPLTMLLRIAPATTEMIAKSTRLARADGGMPTGGPPGNKPVLGPNVPKIARATSAPRRPFTSARTKNTTKNSLRFFVQTSNIPERIVPTVAWRGGGLGRYGYAAMGGTAPGGIADGYGVGGGDAVGVANSGLPHEMQ